MARPKARVKAPKTARPGEIVTIKTLLSHPMESGHRIDRETGAPAPRKIIHTFTATFAGELVVKVGLEPGVAANPYFAFEMRVPGPGALVCEWIDDDGSVIRAEKLIREAA